MCVCVCVCVRDCVCVCVRQHYTAGHAYFGIIYALL